MKLTKSQAFLCYQKLIFNRRCCEIWDWEPGETEIHHIIPKCLLKDKKKADLPANKIRLYSYEHLLAHYYLSIIYDDVPGLVLAYKLMRDKTTGDDDTIENILNDSQHYQKVKKEIAKLNSKTYIEKFGKRKAAEIKRKIRKAKLNTLIRILP